MAAKIPATVVTGFLGAGKTTLIRHMLQNAQGKKIALIINEFGDLGVDGDILKGCGAEVCTEDDIVELSNGCICCTLVGPFANSIDEIELSVSISRASFPSKAVRISKPELALIVFTIFPFNQ